MERHHVQRPGRAIATVHRPTRLRDALALLAEDPTRRPLAGGTDLLLDLARTDAGEAVDVVDLTAVAGLDSIDWVGPHIEIGASVTHADVVRHSRLRDDLPVLVQACAEIGSPQLRNRATLAGNLATASPANDSISALVALDASLRLVSLAPDGELRRREVAIEDFFRGVRRTALAPGELIEAILVPLPVAGTHGIWVKLGLRRAQAISVVHAGVVVTRDDDKVAQARIAVGSVAPTVVRAREAEAALAGRPLDSGTIAAAARAAADGIAPIDDLRATATYRREVVEALLVRALTAIVDDTVVDVPQETPTLGRGARPSLDAPERLDTEAMVSIRVDGEVVRRNESGTTLLEWLRAAGRTGTKEGCAEGECGACTVLLDGDAVMSCLVTAAQASGADVSTVEGLADGADPSAVQAGFVDAFAVQCGFCIPGFVVAASRLLEECPQPSDDQIRTGLSGNLCRCTGYYPMFDAVRDASERGGRS